jgi:hypothetical protein
LPENFAKTGLVAAEEELEPRPAADFRRSLAIGIELPVLNARSYSADHVSQPA